MGTAACKAATYADRLDGSIRPFELIEERFDLRTTRSFCIVGATELGLRS